MIRYGTKTFTFQGAKLWNKLDNNVKLLEFKDFKKNVLNWIPNECKCSTCILCKLQKL